MFDFSNQLALVTGGSRGIGKAIAQALLRARCEVWITGKSRRSGWWEEEEHCSYYSVDFRSKVEVEQFCTEIAGRGFNLLVNNAGIFTVSCLEDGAMEHWSALMEVNLRVPALLISTLAPGMRSVGGGRIVNIGSIAGIVSRSGLAAYSTTKAGLVGLTRAAALEFASDQTLVNCLCPAYTKTDMLSSLDENARKTLLRKIPLGRFCKPEEVAPAALFLLSRENTFITGQTLIIDGGVVVQ